jgi:hypothetical protein
MAIRRAGVALPLAVVLLGACGESPVAPPDPSDMLSVRQETALGVYLHAPDDWIDVETQDVYYAWLFERTGLTPARPLEFLKYRNRAHMERLTGKSVNGWAERGTYRFHTIWSTDEHESVHALVSSEWNAAPALMNEGMAVAHQVPVGAAVPLWNGTPVDTLAARALRDGTLPSLADVMESRDFRRHDEGLAYPVAGSFVKSLIERHGYGRLERFFRSSGLLETASQLRADFRAAFGEEIEDAWSVWKGSLRPPDS